jgi:ABC-2 type transport system permease protein
MHRIKVLTKYFIKDALYENFSSFKINKWLMVVLMTLIIGIISAPLGMMVSFLYEPLKSLGQEAMVIAFILLIGGSITFFFGVYTIMNVFFFSNDIEHLLPMPFSSREIVFGKFMAVMVNMIVYSFMLIVPLVIYGIKSEATVAYYCYVLIAIIIVPIFPMIIASIICITLMRFGNITKHKDAFKMITGCLSLILVVVFNIFTQGGGVENSTIVDALSEGENSIIGKITGIFITNNFLSHGLINNDSFKGLLYMGLAILISLSFLIAFYIIGGKLYLKGIIGISESYSKRENVLKSKDAHKLTKRSTPLKALVMKDLKIILRTPQFFINCIAILFYMPAIFGVMLFSNGGITELSKLIESTDSWDSRILALIFIAVSMFISSGGAGVTALSREGKDFMVSKYIPVPYEVHLESKIISSLCINEICAVIITAVLIALGIKPLLLIVGVIIAISAVALITLMGMYFDFKSPKLDWDDEKTIMKNNWMPLLIMTIMLIMGGTLFVIAIFIKSSIIMFMLIMTIIGVSSYIFYNRLLILAEKIYNEN